MPPAVEVPPRFLITDYHHGFAIGELHIKVITDIACHLWCCHTDKPLRVHNLADPVRGTTRMKYPYYCFVEFTELEQLEPGDTFHHRFHMPAFAPGQERWYYFYGYQLGELTNSVSPVFHVKYHEESEMITLGIYDETQTLEGEVKLEEGDGVTLTRNDGHNSIIITAIAAAPAGFGLRWTETLVPPDAAIFPSWQYDELTVGIGAIGHEARIYTARMTIWDFLSPHAFELAAKRSADATGTQTVWMAIAASAVDLEGNPNHPHIGFNHWNNHLYASNADGAARTTTYLGSGLLADRRWLRYERQGAQIRFYVDGLLAATHVTNLPAATANCRCLLQFIGASSAPRTFFVTQPRHRPLAAAPAAAVFHEGPCLERKQVAAPGVWEDWDLSGIVPAGTHAVQLHLKNDSAANVNFSARTNGSARLWSDLREYLVTPRSRSALLVEVGADRIIEIYCSRSDPLCNFNIAGWFSP